MTYIATLSGGANGISAKDVAGRDIPGLDKIALSKVTVSAGRLVADMEFGAKKTPGELAAFHVGGQESATMAFTLDKLAFSDLVPGLPVPHSMALKSTICRWLLCRQGAQV